MTQEERSNIARLIRRETCCGLMEAAIAVDKLIYALKHGPSVIMDKPRELEVTWKERIASDLDAAYQSGKADMKKQMMKNALHGWLDEDNEPPYDLNVHCEEKIPFGEFKHCDKIRIIIMKEDEK